MLFSISDDYKDLFGIYGIKNLQNNKVYVGQTGESFQRRFWHHRWKLKDNTHDNYHLQAAWNKYGEDSFEFFIIEIVNDIDCLDDLEIKYIQLYQEQKLSYNILGGGGGRRGTPMSDHAKEIVGNKNRQHMIGKTHSEETKRKMSQSRKGQSYNHYKCTNVLTDDLAKDIKTQLIKGIKGKEIAKSLGISYTLVNNILSNNAWSHIIVDGWEEFQENRKTYHRKNISNQQKAEIYDLYINQHIPSKVIAKRYNCSSASVTKIAKEYNK